MLIPLQRESGIDEELLEGQGGHSRTTCSSAQHQQPDRQTDSQTERQTDHCLLSRTLCSLLQTPLLTDRSISHHPSPGRPPAGGG